MKGTVYLIKVEGTNKFKIGYTTKGVSHRLKQLQTANPDPLCYVNDFKCKHYMKLESYLHNVFKNKLIDGEWFYLTEDDVENFNNTCNSLHETIEVLVNENPFY